MNPTPIGETVTNHEVSGMVHFDPNPSLRTRAIIEISTTNTQGEQNEINYRVNCPEILAGEALATEVAGTDADASTGEHWSPEGRGTATSPCPATIPDMTEEWGTETHTGEDEGTLSSGIEPVVIKIKFIISSPFVYLTSLHPHILFAPHDLPHTLHTVLVLLKAESCVAGMSRLAAKEEDPTVGARSSRWML